MCEVISLKLCVSDLSGLLMNEAKAIAEKFGVKYEYKKLMNAREMDLEILRACVEKILSQVSPQEIAEIVKKTDPYPGAVEFLRGIKTKGYETHVITDNPFAGLSEVKEVLKEKLPVEEIHATARISEETLTIKEYITKPEIFETIYYGFYRKPEGVLGILQGNNDISLAYKIKEYGGRLIVANSHSKELKRLADYHVKNTNHLPEILEKI